MVPGQPPGIQVVLVHGAPHFGGNDQPRSQLRTLAQPVTFKMKKGIIVHVVSNTAEDDPEILQDGCILALKYFYCCSMGACLIQLAKKFKNVDIVLYSWPTFLVSLPRIYA